MARNGKDGLHLRIDKVLMAHYLENDDRFLFRGRNENTWKLFYLESGSLTADMGDASQVVRAGHVVFCGPEDFYAISAYDRPSNLLILSFECSDPILSTLRNKTKLVSADMRAFLRSIMLGIKQNNLSPTNISSLLA